MSEGRSSGNEQEKLGDGSDLLTLKSWPGEKTAMNADPVDRLPPGRHHDKLKGHHE